MKGLMEMNAVMALSQNPVRVEELDGILIQLYILERATERPVRGVELTRELNDRGVRCNSDSVSQVLRNHHRCGYLAAADGHASDNCVGAFLATDRGSDEARRLLGILMDYCRTSMLHGSIHHGE